MLLSTGRMYGTLGGGGGGSSEAMTWNSADKATGITLYDSDREAYVESGSVEAVRATKAISSGKYVWCMHVDNSINFRAGIATSSLDVNSDLLGNGTTNVVINTATGGVLYNGSTVTTLSTYTAGDYLMIAFDNAAGDIWFGKNGTWSGDPGAGTGAAKADVAAGTWYPVFGASGGPAGKVTLIRYPYTAPTGFTKLEPAALAGSKHWESIFQLALTSSETGWNGYNLREVLTAAQLLDKGSKNPTKVRVRLKGGTGENAQIDSSHIGLQAGAGDLYDFDGSQVALNISGSNAYTVTAGTLVTSDEFTIAVNGTVPLVLAWHFNNSAADIIAAEVNGGHSAYYKLAANETGTSNVSGYTDSAVSSRFVQEVQALVDD